MSTETETQPNPRRKFYLLRAIKGPLELREKSVAELESYAAEHGIDISDVPR